MNMSRIAGAHGEPRSASTFTPLRSREDGIVALRLLNRCRYRSMMRSAVACRFAAEMRRMLTAFSLAENHHRPTPAEIRPYQSFSPLWSVSMG